MIRYTIIRTIWIFIILFIVLSMNFTMLRLAPVYPPPTEEERDIWYARQVSDGYMTMRRVTDPDKVDEIREGLREGTIERVRNDRYLYDEENHEYRIFEPVPISQQYVQWMGNILTEWNWGTSTRYSPNVPVFDILMRRIPITVQLNIIALFFYIPIGFVLGILAALKKNSLADNIISITVMIGISIPSFVVMSILVLVFGYQLGWADTQFPPSDVRGAFQISAFALPVLGLSFGAIASLTRVTRAELTEVLTSEFLLLARTKGLTRPQAVVRHAIRNSLVPLVPGIIFSFVGLLSGSVIIEMIYSIPGTGRIYIAALNAEDYNLVLGITAFYTVVSLFAVLLVDLSYGVVDPRIRMGARK